MRAFIAAAAAINVKGDGYYTVFESGKDHAAESTGYERVVTPRFAADSDDIFMR